MAYEILRPEWGGARPIRGVLFDMDGLVLDSEVLYSRFWREACAHFGFTMSYEQSLQMRSLGRELGEATIQGFFGPTADYTAIRTRRIQLMNAYIEVEGIAPKPGIFELLAFLKEQGIPAAITSSAPTDRIHRDLSFHGLDTAFAALCSGWEVKRGKPEPDIYLHGAAALGLQPEDCLALEDSPAGLLSANRAGCLPVMIPDLDPANEVTRPLCYGIADSLTDIIDIIKQQNGHR